MDDWHRACCQRMGAGLDPLGAALGHYRTAPVRPSPTRPRATSSPDSDPPSNGRRASPKLVRTTLLATVAAAPVALAVRAFRGTASSPTTMGRVLVHLAMLSTASGWQPPPPPPSPCADDDARLASDSQYTIMSCADGFASYSYCSDDMFVELGAPAGWFISLCPVTCGTCRQTCSGAGYTDGGAASCPEGMVYRTEYSAPSLSIRPSGTRTNPQSDTPCPRGTTPRRRRCTRRPVSYTHLTLPTICSV